jgi:signal transduction histidine kinase
MDLEAPPIRVLAIEDDPLYADLVRHLLRRDRIATYELRCARTLTEGLSALESEVVDVVLADLHLPDSSGMETVERLLDAASGVPVVVLTGVEDDVVGTEAVRRGAQDYLVKQEVRGGILGRVLRYALERSASEKHEQKRVSELAAAYAELERTQGMLVQAERMSAIGQMAGGIAQEVKSPLTLVAETIDYLDRALLDPRAEDHADAETARRLDAMRGAVARADAIVQGLLEFSRPNQPHMERADFEKLVRRAAEIAVSECRREAADVVVEADPGISLITDRRQLSQVLLNVLMNALQASEPGSRVTVRVRCDRPPSSSEDLHTVRAGATTLTRCTSAVICDVVDTGRGIPSDLLPRVFEPFFTTKSAGEGVGLGLAVSRRMIEQLGGVLEISSRLGRGTVARVMLPAVALE